MSMKIFVHSRDLKNDYNWRPVSKEKEIFEALGLINFNELVEGPFLGDSQKTPKCSLIAGSDNKIYLLLYKLLTGSKDHVNRPIVLTALLVFDDFSHIPFALIQAMLRGKFTEQRFQKVISGLYDHYLKNGKPELALDDINIEIEKGGFNECQSLLEYNDRSADDICAFISSYYHKNKNNSNSDKLFIVSGDHIDKSLVSRLKITHCLYKDIRDNNQDSSERSNNTVVLIISGIIIFLMALVFFLPQQAKKVAIVINSIEQAYRLQQKTLENVLVKKHHAPKTIEAGISDNSKNKINISTSEVSVKETRPVILYGTSKIITNNNNVASTTNEAGISRGKVKNDDFEGLKQKINLAYTFIKEQKYFKKILNLIYEYYR